MNCCMVAQTFGMSGLLLRMRPAPDEAIVTPAHRCEVFRMAAE